MGSSRIKRFKGKFYDMGTGNMSFLQLALDLKTLNVENWFFMLEIKDYSLINVDPHKTDKNGNCTLTQDEIDRIIIECTRNVWYYLREVCRIPDPGNPHGIPYKANRGNIAQAWLILHGIDSWLCLPRQQGKTQSALALQTWAFNFGTSGATFIFVNKDGENAKENLKRMVNQIDLLPEYLRFESYIENGKLVKAKRSATKIEHPVNGNSVIIKAKATSRESALSLARGLSAPILHFDEPEFTSHIGTIVSNSASTFETVARRSRDNGVMYARIFTCTPGDLDTQMGLEAEQILQNTIKWTDRFFDMKTTEEMETYIRKQGDSNKIVYIEFQYYQIGLTRAWMENIAAMIGDKLTVRREILLQRIHGSSLSPYDQEDIEYINDKVCQPIKEIYLMDYYRFDIYEEIDPCIPYIASIDCATGNGGEGDSNAITILHPYKVRPVAEFECCFIGETAFEKLIITMVEELVPRAIIVIERNSIGDGIIDHLLETKVAPRLYFDKAKDLLDEKMKENQTIESMLKRQAESKRFYGVYTEGHSREVMFSILARHIREKKDDFVTKNITRDISRLVKLPSGKIAAGPKMHDDSIMSYLIGLYVLYHGNNLELFGYEPGKDEPEKRNQGIETYDAERLSKILPTPLVQIIEEQQKITQQLNYNSVLQAAMKEAQKDSSRLAKAKTVKVSTAYAPPTTVYDEFDEGSIDLGLFDSLNDL